MRTGADGDYSSHSCYLLLPRVAGGDLVRVYFIGDLGEVMKAATRGKFRLCFGDGMFVKIIRELS